MAYTREIKKLIAEMTDMGWKVDRTGSGHYKWTKDGYQGHVISSSSPNCPFICDKIRKDLDRLIRNGKVR